MTILHAILIAIIEGLTEFLPISSTGHMILLSHLLGYGEDDFTKTFEIFIQLGAILAIVFLYARKFLLKPEIYYKLFVAFLPSAVLGFLFYKIIKTYLFNHWVVAISLILGGVVLIVIDKRLHALPEKDHADLAQVSYRTALFIGLFQVISMIPGVSRAAATIIGGMANGLSKKQAAEFSFLLAIPTMAAASGYDLLKFEGTITGDQWGLLILGFIVAFITAIGAVIWFVKLLERYGFAGFGWYRIGIGVLFLLFAGWSA